MNSSTQNYLNLQVPINWEEQTIEKEVVYYKEPKESIGKIKIQIKFTSDQQIIYSQNGAILRVVGCLDVVEKSLMFNNMDQIHNLQWQGKYGNKKKDGKWVAFWDKELLWSVGGYYKEGQKWGLWKDLFLNYCNQAQIFEIGEYFNDLRIGKWDYLYQDKKIGGGFYNKDGQKQGKWIELDERFYDDKIVIYRGEYYMKFTKIGIWDIMYSRDGEKEYKQMEIQFFSGGGLYDQEGNEKKVGNWVELDEGFYSGEYNSKQVTYNGKYDVNGRKIGKWDIMYKEQGKKKYKQIGGGSYDQEGNQKKVGNWVELDEKFDYWKEVTHNGEYNMNGNKVGIWVGIDIIINQNIGSKIYDN